MGDALAIGVVLFVNIEILVDLEICQQSLFFLGDVDVSVFQRIHFDINIRVVATNLLKLIKEATHILHTFKWNLINKLFRGRVIIFFDTKILALY